MGEIGTLNDQHLARVGHVDAQVATVTAPGGAFAEHMRTLGMRLVVGPGATAAGALAVVSPATGDGRSTLAANLAVVLAQSGRRTVLIDADLRSPAQHRLFSCDPVPGIAGFNRDSELPIARAVDAVPGLFVIPCGLAPGSPFDASVLAPDYFGQLLAELRGRVDHIVIDTPPGLAYGDGHGIAAQTGSAIMVVRRHRTAIAQANRMAEQVRAMGAAVLGTVLNNG